VTNLIYYEQPLNERIRAFLRLEQLLARFDHHIEQATTWDTHCAISTLIEIYTLTTRGDIKSDLMKELEREIANLAPLADDPHVNNAELQRVVHKQRAAIDKLHGMSGQLGQHLKNNDFIGAIRQRSALPGGTCDFDLPVYHFWLAQPADKRHTQLAEWIEPYAQIQEALALVLTLVRRSAVLHPQVAKNGFYQQNLDPSGPHQLIRIALPHDATCHPEISAGKHRFSVRFLVSTSLDARATQTQETIRFDLAVCAL
jgi:cell division protein ZapD